MEKEIILAQISVINERIGEVVAKLHDYEIFIRMMRFHHVEHLDIFTEVVRLRELYRMEYRELLFSLQDKESELQQL